MNNIDNAFQHTITPNPDIGIYTDTSLTGGHRGYSTSIQRSAEKIRNRPH